MVAYAVNHQTRFQSGTAAGNIKDPHGRIGADTAVVPVLFPVYQQFLPGLTPPPVQCLIPGQPPAVVVVLHAPEGVDFRQVGAVSEGVGREIQFQHIRRNVPVLGQILLGVPDVPQEGFGVRHVLVGFHPGRGGHFPPAFPDSLLDAGFQMGRIVVHDFIHGGLGLAEGELRIFVHDV